MKNAPPKSSGGMRAIVYQPELVIKRPIRTDYMKRQGFDAAIREAIFLRETYDNLVKAPNYDTALKYWAEFLTRLQRIYNKLDAATLDGGRSRAWMGRKKAERSADKLLQYLHQARHSDEHSIEPIAENSPSLMITAPPSGSAYVRNIALTVDGQIVLDAVDRQGNAVSPEDMLTINHLKLAPVVNRGQTYDPPRTHLGVPIDPDHIKSVGALVIKYVDKLLTEAREFVPL
jgi:hypothetical protein